MEDVILYCWLVLFMADGIAIWEILLLNILLFIQADVVAF